MLDKFEFPEDENGGKIVWIITLTYIMEQIPLYCEIHAQIMTSNDCMYEKGDIECICRVCETTTKNKNLCAYLVNCKEL